MGSRPVYQADREIIDACAAQGVTVTARQLERWRKYLPSRPVTHQGVRGSETENPHGYQAVVIAIAQATARRTPLRQIPLVLFAHGLPVDLTVLRDAYLELINFVITQIENVTAPADGELADPSDRPDRLALLMSAQAGNAQMFRNWQSRARQAVRSGQAGAANDPQSFLAGALSAAFTGPLTGQPASTEGITEALTVLGLNDGQDPSDTAQHLARLTFAAIRHAIEAATWEDWVSARDDYAAIHHLTALRSSVEARILPEQHRLTGLTDLPSLAQDPVGYASQIAGLLLTGTAEWRERVTSETASYQAVDSLLNALPSHVHQYLGPTGMPEPIRQELASTVNTWAERHPSYADLLFPDRTHRGGQDKQDKEDPQNSHGGPEPTTGGV